MSNLKADLDRGVRAERLLTDPFIDEAFKAVSQSIHDRWEVCPVRDMEGAHQLRLMLKLLGDVRAVFESAVADGKAAAAELERLDSRRVLSPREWQGR